MEGSDAHPKWYAHVCYVVPATQLPATPEARAIGVNRNVGQCTDSNGKMYETPGTDHTNAKLKQYQRKMDRQQKDSHRRRRTGHKLSKLHRQRTRIHRHPADWRTKRNPWWWWTSMSRTRLEVPRTPWRNPVPTSRRSPVSTVSSSPRAEGR